MENVINTSTSTKQENLSTSETDWNNSSLSTSNTSSSSEENDDIFFPLMKYLISGHELHDSGYIPSHSFGVKPIEAKLCFLVFLWHLANTEPLRTISDRFDISISSVFRVIQKPNVENARDYCNRKRYFSVNLQAVVDSNMKFTNTFLYIYCDQPGSLHDARVLRKSPLYNSANEDREVIFPNGKFIIEDSAYPSLQWLVPPFRDNGHLTPLETEFNFIHSERTFSMNKIFFRISRLTVCYKYNCSCMYLT
ncbi:hypothetical protein ALC60_06431 [Trachymyrmex zeteki]|uniref:DDE Tnp4 domain-containing protein n=1 Tax=Mycetomoellerius zeteki TaxID=64791 RepID=A0A151X2M9_9HYME|nr:hypothetical protein ALC60_06431 [Trachymyrmex zeteki]